MNIKQWWHKICMTWKWFLRKCLRRGRTFVPEVYEHSNKRFHCYEFKSAYNTENQDAYKSGIYLVSPILLL